MLGQILFWCKKNEALFVNAKENLVLVTVKV